MLASLVRVDAPTFALVLRSHNGLKNINQRLYVDDNTDPATTDLFKNVTCTTCVVDASVFVEPMNAEYRTSETHIWKKERISRVTSMRNAVIKEFLKTDCTHLFFVDADIVFHPDTVEHLLAQDVDVVSPVFWTRWTSEGVLAPQVWDVNPYGHWSVDRVLRLREPGLYDVHGLGAATLIKREVLARGVDYTPIPSLDMEGEDRHFVTRCEAHGFRLFGDATYPPFHVYRASQLDEATIWFYQGCDPSYFASAWLTDEWEQQVRGAWQIQTQRPERESLAICIPGETFSGAWVSTFMQMFTNIASKVNVQVFNVWSSNPSVTRQALSHAVLSNEKKFDYVLWIDDDNLLNAEHVDRMMNAFRAYPTIDLVAGWCSVTREFYDLGDNVVSCGTFTKEGRCAHDITEQDMTDANGLVHIEWTGFPGVMMRYGLLQRLTPRAFVPIFDDSLEWGFFGEDASFSKRACQQGAVMVADPKIKIPHIKLRDANTPTVKTLVQQTQKG